MKNKCASMLLASLCLGVLLTGCGKAPDSGENTAPVQAAKQDVRKLTFVLDWTPNTNHTGIYVAREKGYFKDAGLEVEIVQPPENGAEVLAASGKAQFAMSFQDSLAPAFSGDNPLPVTAVAGVIQHNTSGIISRRGEGMDRPKGLEGKKYATWDLPVEKATIKDVMEADGGDFDKVELIPSTVTDEVTALKTKSVDAIWIFYAWAGVKTELEGLETSPAILMQVSASDSAVMAFIENIQRQNLSFLEEAEGYRNMMEDYGLTQEELAAKLSKSQSSIANKLRILKLEDSVKKLLLEHHFTERHARALLKLPDEESRLFVLAQMIQEEMNVKKTEELIEATLEQMRPRFPEKGEQKEKRYVRSSDFRLFTNTIKQSVEVIRRSGVDVVYEDKQDADCCEILIRIRKNAVESA